MDTTKPTSWRARAATPFASSDAIRAKMSTQPSRDTGPELALRSALHRRGLRYRVHCRPLPSLARVADVVFPIERVAIFVDGCFWHGCEQHGRRKHDVNGWYWPAKIARNRARDEDTTRRLVAKGWTVIRVWEHEEAEPTADIIENLVRQRRSALATGASSAGRTRPGTRSPRQDADK